MTVESPILRQSVPRVFQKVCAYIDIDDCYLSEQQAINPFFMTLNPGVSTNEDNIIKTRTAIIQHKPSVCPQPLQNPCSYLITVYNPDPYGPVRVTVKIANSDSR